MSTPRGGRGSASYATHLYMSTLRGERGSASYATHISANLGFPQVCPTALQAAPSRAARKEEGGLIVEGPDRHVLIAQRIEAARHTPPRFASMRNKVACNDPVRVPYDVLPSTVRDVEHTVPDAVSPTPLLRERLRYGPVSVQECVGQMWEPLQRGLVVLRSTFARAAAGQPYARPPTVRVSIDDLPPFAREAMLAGLTLEFMSGGPGDGRLLQPSTAADTQCEKVFPGRKLDASAWTRTARAIGCQDLDIMAQASAGVQMRTTPPHAISIAFPHRGFMQNLALVRPKIEAEISEGWTLPPFAHLPLLPMTVTPRDGIIQQKVKEDEHGELRMVDSVRVTTDLSYGGDEAPNAGMSDAEAIIRLPTVQQGGRAAAAIDGILQGREIRHPAMAHLRITVSHTGRRRGGVVGGTRFVTITRGTPLGNMFRMGVGDTRESLRDSVCDAFDEVLRNPRGADFLAIAARHKIPQGCVDKRCLQPGARKAMMAALVDLAHALWDGLHLDLQCGRECAGRRCHGHGIKQLLTSMVLLVGVETGQADLSSAYYYIPAQRLDWNRQVFLWPTGQSTELDGAALGFAVATRLVFGGRHGPNRFDRIGDPPMREAWERIAAFEAANPPLHPELAQLWDEWRQRRPEGQWQAVGAFVKKYIDDLEAKALNDHVQIPRDVEHVSIPGDLTASVGFFPSHPHSRAAVYLRILIDSFQRCGFTVAKVQCGSGGVDLGMQITMPRAGVSRGGIDIAAVKCWALDNVAVSLQASVSRALPISRALVERFTGQLVNISQLEPSLTSRLAAGYAVANVRVSRAGQTADARGLGRRGTLVDDVRVLPTGKLGRALRDLLATTRHILRENEGIPLSPERTFWHTSDPAVCTITTDVSGDDGIGGFAFHASRPHTVWILSEMWTSTARTALQQAAAVRAATSQGGEARLGLSMPAAEMFGAYACAAAMREAVQGISAFIAIGDCAPACAAINKNSSGVSQMRLLLQAAVEVTPNWLAVHVHREFNLDADRLSHPANAPELVQHLRLRGWEVIELEVPLACWHRLEAAIAEGPGRLAFEPDE